MDIQDASGYAGRADRVFTPSSEEEIAEIVSKWSGVPVTRLVEGEKPIEFFEGM